MPYHDNDVARLTYKTDFKFGLLILLILLGTFFFVARTLRSDRIDASQVEGKLHRLMTRKQVEAIFRGRRGAMVLGGSAKTIDYSVQDPNGGLANNFHFTFDASNRLILATVDDEFRPGYFTNRTIALK